MGEMKRDLEIARAMMEVMMRVMLVGLAWHMDHMVEDI